MSSFDYSRFDKVGEDEPDTEEQQQAELRALKQANAANGEGGSGGAGIAVAEEGKPDPIAKTKKGKNGRFVFEHEGRTVYEWEQVCAV